MIPPIAGDGWRRILFSRRADSPFCSSTDALVRRWLMVSPSNCPVCLASADPSFLSCSNPTLCQPPRDSATTGMNPGGVVEGDEMVGKTVFASNQTKTIMLPQF